MFVLDEFNPGEALYYAYCLSKYHYKVQEHLPEFHYETEERKVVEVGGDPTIHVRPSDNCKERVDVDVWGDEEAKILTPPSALIGSSTGRAEKEAGVQEEEGPNKEEEKEGKESFGEEDHSGQLFHHRQDDDDDQPPGPGGSEGSGDSKKDGGRLEVDSDDEGRPVVGDELPGGAVVSKLAGNTPLREREVPSAGALEFSTYDDAPPKSKLTCVAVWNTPWEGKKLIALLKDSHDAKSYEFATLKPDVNSYDPLKFKVGEMDIDGKRSRVRKRQLGPRFEMRGDFVPLAALRAITNEV
uniref:Uncharacterized protein n=1 Tax=Chromera velia CCMP2878 TaxID=1169474 RepID=A0A0G4H324_9ALVE|eukprot:Cvel_24510.t1-p1 / transcript=Cvel_24510.t1 / gene=Cvel_24510 / organism=Chromera_velia_CCMP2878 / gene_product=hypothetical protein / transcript_product=hypothetical protein / location=Cvel_scaffold2659:8806-9910(-) / protein_length=297 / sequence_SO=supercontig / SO=protein_coding / is_pseudo=false